MDKFSYRFTSMFRPEKGVYIDCFINNIYINFLILRRTKVLLSGASGSGKSYSALKMATGIAKKCNSGIAYIGTEGSRNKYYANEFDYDLLELEEPFECEKYMAAIDEAVKAGYKVLIIDSMTHEWKWLNDVHDKMAIVSLIGAN